MFDRDDWNKRLDEKKKEKLQSEENSNKFALRTSVEMTRLTGSEEWDKYLTYLQGLLETSNVRIGELEEKILSPEIFGHDDMIKLKSQIIQFRERSTVLEFVMSFPKEIIEYGKVAKKKLKL